MEFNKQSSNVPWNPTESEVGVVWMRADAEHIAELYGTPLALVTHDVQVFVDGLKEKGIV